MYQLLFKRIIDLFVSLIVFPLFLLLTIFIGFLIYRDDKGPIFYKAPRLGKNGKVFSMYKFRSMKNNAPDFRNDDGSTFNSEDDPRVTNIGKILRKSSIDEVPQVINVLLGNMSLIGPRPDLPEHYKMYEGNEKRKLEVKPGITGYNQAYFRNSIPWKERIQNDIYYIDHLSFMMDLKVLIQTILTVIKKDDIYANK